LGSSKFWTKNKKQKVDEKFEESKKQETEEEHYEFKHDESYDEDNTANFSTRRKIFFAIGKAIKYSIWTYCVLFAYHFYLVRKKEKPEEAIGWIDLFLDHAYRFNWHCKELNILLTRPPVDKLMPDKPPLPPHMKFPKTLIISLRGTTVRSEYKLGIGFEFKKRPGLSTFIQRMARSYEVVVFADEETSLVQEIWDVLDPNQMIIYGRLGHESTLLKEGRYIRDLSYMNRDIKDIVCLDFDPEKYYHHQENVIKIPEWNGEQDDRILIDIIPFMEHIAQGGDVRKELDKYGRDNPSKRFNEIQSARRDLISQKMNSGISGMVNKYTKTTPKAQKFDEDTMFPSQYKGDE
jgi:hypothetical protein